MRYFWLIECIIYKKGISIFKMNYCWDIIKIFIIKKNLWENYVLLFLDNDIIYIIILQKEVFRSW